MERPQINAGALTPYESNSGAQTSTGSRESQSLLKSRNFNCLSITKEEKKKRTGSSYLCKVTGRKGNNVNKPANVKFMRVNGNITQTEFRREKILDQLKSVKILR